MIANLIRALTDPLAIERRPSTFNTELTYANVISLMSTRMQELATRHMRERVHLNPVVQGDPRDFEGCTVCSRDRKFLSLLLVNLFSYFVLYHESTGGAFDDSETISGLCVASLRLASDEDNDGGSEFFAADFRNGEFIAIKMFPSGEHLVSTMGAPGNPLRTIVECVYPDYPEEQEQLRKVEMDDIMAALQSYKHFAGFI